MRFSFLKLCFGFLFLSSLAFAQQPLLIITHSYMRPDFIEIQEKTFRKFMKTPYEFVVFNDGKTKAMARSIKKTCDQLNIKCVRIPQKIHKGPYLPRDPGEPFNHPCTCCANVVQYSLNELGFEHDGLVMIIDSDMFLIKDFNVEEYMKDCDLSGVPQSRGHINYIWNGIVFFNMNTLPEKRTLSFNCGRVEGIGCDVGGYTHYYFKNHPELRYKNIPQHTYVEALVGKDTSSLSPLLKLVLEEGATNTEFFMDETLFHYRGGGNWDYKSQDYHDHKTKVLNKLIDYAMTEN